MSIRDPGNQYLYLVVETEGEELQRELVPALRCGLGSL
jgi:hypothetical protein